MNNLFTKNDFISSQFIAWILFFISITIFLLYIYHNSVRWDALFYNSYAFFLIFKPYTVYAHLGTLFISVWLLFSAWGIGHTILSCLTTKIYGKIIHFESIAIGFGCISLIVFFLALLQFLSLLSISLTLIVGSIFGIFAIFQNKPVNQSAIVSAKFQLTLVDKVVLAFILISIFYAFISSLMPPTQSDGLRYHLTAPKLFLKHGGFFVIPNLSFSNFPFLVEYLFVIPMAFGFDSGAKLIHFSYFILSLGFIYHLANLISDRQVGLYSVLLFSTIPFVPIFASWSFIEFGLVSYTLLAFIYAIRIFASQQQSVPYHWAILLGIASGFLLGCKYTAFATVTFLLLISTNPAYLIKNKSFKQHSLTVICATFLMGLVASPWYIKNLILFQNPLYPFAGSLFPTPNWSEFNNLFFSFHAGMKGSLNAVKQYSLPEQALDLITLPFRVIFFPGGQNHREDFGSWPLGSIWLVLIILLFFKRNYQKNEWLMIIFSSFLFLVWAFTYRDTRFLLPSLAVLTPILAKIALEFINTLPFFKWLFLSKILYSMLFTTGLLLVPVTYGPWWVVSGTISEKDYLAYYNNFTRDEAQAAFWLTENTSPDTRVLLHGVDQPYYFENDYVSADFFDTDPLLQWSWSLPDTNELINRMQQENIQYLVYNYGKINQFGLFYHLFRLHPDKSIPLLKDFLTNEALKLNNPDQYHQWLQAFNLKLQLAEANSANIDALNQLFNNNVLEVVFEFDDDPDDPSDGIKIFRIPESEEFASNDKQNYN